MKYPFTRTPCHRTTLPAFVSPMDLVWVQPNGSVHFRENFLLKWVFLTYKQNILTCHLSINDGWGNRVEFSQSFWLATVLLRPAETLRKLRLHKVTLLRRLRHDARGTPQRSLRSEKPARCKHWSTFSVAAIIPLILLCPLSYSLNEHDGNPLASRHQYFMHLSAWKQCHRPQLIGRRWKRSETMSQS